MPRDVTADRGRLLAAWAAVLLIYGIIAYGGFARGIAADWWTDLAWTLVSLAAGLRCLLSASRASGHMRLAWGLFAAGALVWFAGMLWWDHIYLLQREAFGYPRGYDLLFRMAAILFMFATFYYGIEAPGRRFTVIEAANFGIIICATTIAALFVLYESVRAAALPLPVTVAAVTSPVTFLASFLFALATFWTRMSSRGRRVFLPMLIALLLHGVVELLFALNLLGQSLELEANALNIVWLVAFALQYWSAFEQDVQPAEPGGASIERRSSLEALAPSFSLGVILACGLIYRQQLDVTAMTIAAVIGLAIAVLLMVREVASSRLERRLREQRLRSESQVQAIVEHSPMVVTVKDTEGCFQLVNRVFEQTFGVSASEATGRSAAEVLPRQLAERVEALDRKVLTTLAPNVSEQTYSFEGSERTFLTVKFPMLDADGRPMSIGAIYVDITEQKTAEQAALEREAQLRGILDSTTDGILVIDEHATIQSVNSRVLALTGHTEQELLGQPLHRLLPGSQSRVHLQRCMGDGGRSARTRSPEVEACRKDGSTFPAEFGVGRLVLPDARLRFIVTLRDLTEHKATESQLRQAQKMEAVGQLTGGIAHDFNNILAVVIGNLELLGDSLSGKGRLHEFIGKAMRATERGAELTQRLLAFSRQQPLRPSAVDAADVVAGLLDMLSRTLGETIEIRSVRADALPMALVDRGQLENALLNLAINARDAMPGGGRLTISTSDALLDEAYAADNPEVAPGQYVLVTVTDDGAGIPAEHLDRVFEPFFSTKDIGKGSGLGLSMVYGFARQTGGHVKIESEVGQGTTVRLYLPIAEGETGTARDRTPTGRELCGHGQVVLVVEDDAAVRELAIAMLAELGYCGFEAADGTEALQVLESEPIDLLFTDVILPGSISGTELARVARAGRPGLPVMFMSGYTDRTTLRCDDGEYAVITKPFRRDEIAVALRTALRGAAATGVRPG